MTDSAARRTLFHFAAAWLALSLSHLLLQALAPRGVFSDPLLPAWARIALLATESALIAAALVPAGLLFRALRLAELRCAPRGRWAFAAVRCVAAALLLLLLAASWGVFWLSGQYLDGEGFRFAWGNLGSVLAYATHIHPLLVYGMPGLLLAAAALACEGIPRWADRLSDRSRTLATAGSAALLLLTIATAAAGEVGHRWSTKKITDETTGAVYSRDDLYRFRRNRNTGPLTHSVAVTLESKDPLDADSSDPAPRVLCRPQVPLDQYVATVDQARLKRWNVVVVLVDSLRADQLRAAGGSREVMPAVEALARAGTVFPDCITQASHTDYAAPAVFSSHYPLRSRDVYRYPKDPIYPRVMVYDVLKALGWRTALFSSQNEDWGQMLNYLQTGGLDVCFHSKSLGVSEAATKDRPPFAGSLDDAVTVSESMKWIEREPDVPFFLYLNLQNSHLPYDVPRDFRRRFAPADVDVKISIGWFPKEKVDVVKDVYADSLAYVDSQLDHLFGSLKARGLWDRTIVVVTGDHGEAFYEHGSAAHANGVYQEVIQVPLVIRAPGMAPVRDDRPAQLIDVVPGLFHLLGLPPHPGFQGEDPFAPGFRPDRARFSICDTPWRTQIGVLRSGFKMIRESVTGTTVLYDLANDPGEKADAAERHPERARELRALITAWRRAQLEYYENPLRQAREYPPLLREE
jgi:arylsulfatase A-like enzyme